MFCESQSIVMHANTPSMLVHNLQSISAEQSVFTSVEDVK